jgi:hypothetical protein
MKGLHLILFLFLQVQWLSCEKPDDSNDLILKGKVIRITCASTVVQITNSENFGEDGWQNTFSSGETKYDNVFKVENVCKVKLEEGKEFNFKIITLSQNDCVQCLMYDAPPKVSYAIEII